MVRNVQTSKWGRWLTWREVVIVAVVSLLGTDLIAWALTKLFE